MKLRFVYRATKTSGFGVAYVGCLFPHRASITESSIPSIASTYMTRVTEPFLLRVAVTRQYTPSLIAWFSLAVITLLSWGILILRALAVA